MQNCNISLQKALVIFLVQIYSLNLIAQDVIHSETVPSLTTTSGNKSQSSFYAGAGYGNNMIYMGSDVSQDKPFFYGSLTYGYKERLFFSVSGNYLSAFDKFPAFASFALSYSHDFNKWLDISLSVSRYQVNNELTDTLFSNFFYGDIAAGVDWKILYTNLSLGGVFSEASGIYLQLRNSRYFETGRFFNNKAYVSFDPFVNLMFGTLTKTVTAEGTIIGVSAPFKSSRSSGGQSQHPSSSVSEFFGLMEADFGLPAGFNLGNLTVEAEPGYVLPSYSSSDIQSPEGFTFFINIYYKIL